MIFIFQENGILVEYRSGDRTHDQVPLHPLI